MNNATSNLIASLQTATNARVSSSQSDTGQNLCTVVGNYNGNIFKATTPDGSEKYFKYLGNANLAIGSQISITSPDLSIISYGDTKAR